MTGMETRLQLLLDDGTTVLTFSPALTTAQYDAILNEIAISITRDDMKAAARQLAAEWRIEVIVEGTEPTHPVNP